MRLESVTATAPSAWASYLINGDASGLEPAELAAADRFVEEVLGALPVDCADEGFRHFHDATAFAPYSADCQTYTALIEAKASGIRSNRRSDTKGN